MGKSQNTINLENDIAAIDQKLKALEAAQKSLSDCKTKVKSSYNNADSDHVKGSKYDTMYEEEVETIDSFSKEMAEKKDGVLETIGTNIVTLSAVRVWKVFCLAASKEADSVAEEAKKTQKKK